MADARYAEAARAWFGKGNSDLRSAQALLALDPPETETAAFHSQQAAEKYLKGLLAYHGDDPPRTHDLAVLLDLALQTRKEDRGADLGCDLVVPDVDVDAEMAEDVGNDDGYQHRLSLRQL